MATVETVNGPVDVEELGLTLIHEHFRTTDEATRFQFPHLYDEDAEWEAAMADANGVKGHGVRTVVEPSAMFLHRDAAFSKRVADESGLNVVLATGIYTYDHLPQPLLNRDEDQIAEIFVHDIEQGIQGTGIKAAFIKCAADEPGVTPNVEKVHRAAARASRQTGRPIMAHSHPKSGTGLEQMRGLRRGGRRPGQGPDRPHRRHRRPRLHRAPARHRLLDRHGPLRARRLPAHGAAPGDRARPAREGPRGPHVPVAGLVLDDRLVHARGGGAAQASLRRTGR